MSAATVFQQGAPVGSAGFGEQMVQSVANDEFGIRITRSEIP